MELRTPHDAVRMHRLITTCSRSSSNDPRFPRQAAPSSNSLSRSCKVEERRNTIEEETAFTGWLCRYRQSKGIEKWTGCVCEGKREKRKIAAKRERQCYGSRKFLRLMVHNKRLSVPKLIMSVHAGLISFPAFNKYVAQVIRHNFSTRRDLVQAVAVYPHARNDRTHANLHERRPHERCITLIFVERLPRNVTELYAS